MEDKFKIAFNTNFVCSLTGASLSQLNSWDKIGLVCPSIVKSCGRGSIRLYSFKDIVEIKTVVFLRNNNIALKQIRLAVEYLKNEFDFSSPLSQLVLISNGKNVLCVPEGQINATGSKWLAADKYGQLVFKFVVPMGAVVGDLNEAIKKYNKRIEESKEEEKKGILIPLSKIEEDLFGISNPVVKPSRKKRLA